MRAYVQRETIIPEAPPITVIKTVMLELTEEEASKLKMLANGITTQISDTSDRRGQLLFKFQSALWEELETRGIPGFYGQPSKKEND